MFCLLLDLAIFQYSCINEDLVGFVKNSAWSHENETRLMLTIKDVQGQDHVDIPTPSSLLRNMQVSIGPRSTLTDEQVKNMMTSHLSGTEFKNWTPKVDYSYFHRYNLLKQLRRHCCSDGCRDIVFKNSLEN